MAGSRLNTVLLVILFALVGTFVPLLVNADQVTDSQSALQKGLGGAGFSPQEISQIMGGINWADAKTADMQCLPVVIPQCGCGQIKGPKGCMGFPMNKWQCTCTDPRGVTGKCTATFQCQGQSYSGSAGQQGGGVDKGLSQLGQMVGQLAQQLMKGGGGGGGSGSGSGAGLTGGASLTGCQGSYYTTSDVSRISDPCAQFVPQVSGGISLSELLGGSSTSDLINAYNTNTNDNTNVSATISTSVTTSGSNTQTQPTTPSQVLYASTSQNFVGLTPLQRGAFGDFVVSQGGVTIFGGNRNPDTNTEVAGFFGTQSFGGQTEGVTAQLCRSRPWAGNFLASILPASFFDGLCTWRGYQVGTPPPSSGQQVQLVQKTVTKATSSKPAATATVPTVKPRVDIWAVPSAVQLGARTTIFWNTQGVSNCTQTSPDGNFHQNSLSGGAATVPLTAATTFTISCIAPDGTPVTNFTTVNIGI